MGQTGGTKISPYATALAVRIALGRCKPVGRAVLRPATDPVSIKDPLARAEPERVNAANRAKANQYRLQIALEPLSERIPPRAEESIRKSHTSVHDDQRDHDGCFGYRNARGSHVETSQAVITA
jgi:hypothetical protein